MQPLKIHGSHVELGREQGFVPLNIRFEITTDAGTGQTYPSMLSAFQPTEHELAALNRGEPLILRILGIDWPPVMITVGDEFDQLAADTGVKYVQHVMRQRREEASADASTAFDALATPVAGDTN